MRSSLQAELKDALSEQAVRIGIGTTLRGPGALPGKEMQQAAQLAVEECNASGGIFGARVGVETQDDEGTREGAERAAHAFCSRADLLGVVGHYNSDTSLPAAEICEPHGVVMITPVGSEPELTGGNRRHLFRFTNTDDRTGLAIANHLVRTMGRRRAAVVATSSRYGESMARRFVEPFVAGGGRVVQEQCVDDGQRDFDGVVTGMVSDADVVFYGGSFEGAFILKAMREAGRAQVFAAGDGCWDRWNFLEVAGRAASQGEGVLVLSATPEIGRVAGSREFAERYAQRYGPIGNYAVNSYDAARLLLTAITNAAVAKGGRPDRNDVFGALRSVDYRGIAYPDPVRWNSSNDNIAAVTALHVVEDGTYRQIAQVPD